MMALDKSYLHERLGSMRQLASIRRMRIDDGKGRGMRVFEVTNGSGLSFSVYPDRGMDIGEASFKGIPLAWITPNGPVAPQFYEADSLGWLRTWGGGLLTGCGLMNVGGANCSGGESHGLHGRLSHTPAEEINSTARWTGDGASYELEVSGELRVSRVFGKNLSLRRNIRTALGDNSITIRDRVENQGFRKTPLMQLYHINLGWPLVDAGAVIEAVKHRITPQNEVAAADYPEWNHLTDPERNFVEQVFYHEIPAAENGMAAVTLRNSKLKLACRVEYSVGSLPYLIEWKMMGQGEYVLGLEPSNTFPEGQEAMARRGLLRFLAPGEVVECVVKISFEELP